MKRAFTIVELIFVIVVIGILAASAMINMPDNRLYTDSDFIVQKIKQIRSNALNIDHSKPGSDSWRSEDYLTNYETNSTCVVLTKDYFKTLEKNSKSNRKYHLSPLTTISPSGQKICFDNLGRAFSDDYQLNKILKEPIVFDINYKQETKEVAIMPYSGATIVVKK